MPKIVKAKKGQTLCEIAIAEGFLDCEPLRNEAANKGKKFLKADFLADGDEVSVPDLDVKPTSVATDQKHTFKKKNAPPVSIRIVHGSPNLPYLQDSSLTQVGVSNFRSDRAGRTGSVAFPSGHAFNAAGHADEDAFKLEIQDPLGGGTVKATVRVLQPIYAKDGSVSGHKPFTGANAPGRELSVDCHLVNSSVCYRSEYLRLVVDTDDQGAIPTQSLIAADIADGQDGAADKVEILDQMVEARYEHRRCTRTPKCNATVRIPIHKDPRRVKVAVHILKDAAGTPVSTKVATRQKVLNYIRQLYAQADLSVKILSLDEITLPANLIAIADARGRTARGGRKIRVRVRIDAGTDVQAEITTTNGDRPIQTATALAAELAKVLPKGTRVTTEENPPLIGQAIGSADILVGDPDNQRVRLQVITSDDPRHPVSIGRLTSPTITSEFGGSDGHVGTAQERVLIKNYDTGDDRVDLFVVRNFASSTLGEAFSPNFASRASRRPIASIANTVIVFANTINAANDHHTTIPHEIGHVLMDAVHTLNVPTEMMSAASPVGVNERVVNGPKRIAANRRLRFDGGVRDVPVDMIRNRNAGLIDSW